MQTPSPIVQALWPKTRRRVLGLLFAHPDERLHLRQIARDTGIAVSAVQREVLSLWKAGIISRQQEGGQVYYQADRSCPVFDELRGLVIKTVGLADVLREALAPLATQIDVAFVYGSCARGEDVADSDVDVMVVGPEPDVVTNNAALLEAGVKLGREVNPVVMSRAEYRSRITQGDHFLNAITAGPLILILGDEDELGRLSSKGTD